jgi:ABC-type amino acid transport substrate-binding protein
MRFSEFERLQVYMLTYMAAALLLTFWILPALVVSLTPFKYKELVGSARTALITAFATGNLFIVLPVLVEKTRELMRTHQPDAGRYESTVDVIISTSYSLPSMGKLLTLGFVLFAGWFAGAAVPVSNYPGFALTGLFSFFGSPISAIPFLLDYLHIPADTFRFFPVLDNLVGVRFGTLLAAMHTLVLAVLGACAVSGAIKIHWSKLLRYTVLSVVLTFGLIGAIRGFFEYIVGHEYQEYNAFVAMDLSTEYNVSVNRSEELLPPISLDLHKSRLQDIGERGFLRVGYFRDALPFAFVNQTGKLVGFDIEMAYNLAQEMNVRLEFVPVERKQAAEMLNRGYVDIIMSGFAATLGRAREITFSKSYMDQTMALIVKDYRRDEFNSREKLQSIEDLKLGIPDVPYYIDRIKQYLPQAELVLLNSPRDFFTREENEFDALVYSAEAGSAWCLVYPEYTVTIPRPDVLALPLVYAMARKDPEWVNYVNTWIELKIKDQTIESLYNNWILGRNAVEEKPRWSVIRNLLHFVN